MTKSILADFKPPRAPPEPKFWVRAPPDNANSGPEHANRIVGHAVMDEATRSPQSVFAYRTALTAITRYDKRARPVWWHTAYWAAVIMLCGMFFAAPVEAENRRIKVVATTGMIADAVRELGGQRVDVKALMGPGVDPHAYRQTRTDIVAMTRADIVIWHGLYLEAQMQEVLQRLGRKRTVIAIAEELPKNVLLTHDVYKNKFDPHVWMNPRLWAKVIVALRDKLSAAFPDAGTVFRANAKRYLARIDKLARYAERALATIPTKRRVLLTAHDAFKYFGQAYRFQVIGIQGISTESEAGLNRINRLVELIVSRKIHAVFVESSVSDRNIRALVEGARARGHAVSVAGTLFSDAMGEDGTYEGTYIGMIDHNVTTIARALGGKPPSRGMSGRLAVRQTDKDVRTR